MAKPRLRYNLYEGEKIVMQAVTAEEIRIKTDTPSLKLGNYVRTGAKIKGLYRVEQSETTLTDEREKFHITCDMWDAWKEVCGRLKGIQGLDRIALAPEK